MGTAKKQDLPTRASEAPGDRPAGLPPGLWVVATPIGNLGDLSARARAALEHAGLIYCEDTRQAAKLLQATGIAAPESGERRAERRLERLDAHASPDRIAHAAGEIAARAARGEGVALVTDAGTPAVSDPGARLVAAVAALDVDVTPVPGPSAVMALLSAAGFEDTAFAFRGFFPRKGGERSRELESCAQSPVARLYVWFESPNRVVDALESLAAAFPGAAVVASKELTKAYERFFRGTAVEVRDRVNREIAAEGERGEWCFAVRFEGEGRSAGEGDAGAGESGEALWTRVLECLIEGGVSASGAARQVSQHFGAPRKSAYDLALRISGKKS